MVVFNETFFCCRLKMYKKVFLRNGSVASFDNGSVEKKILWHRLIIFLGLSLFSRSISYKYQILKRGVSLHWLLEINFKGIARFVCWSLSSHHGERKELIFCWIFDNNWNKDAQFADERIFWFWAKSLPVWKKTCSFLDASTHLYMRVCPSVRRWATRFFFKPRNSSGNGIEFIESV